MITLRATGNGVKAAESLGNSEESNHAIERTADPRHGSCVRTCRATGRGPLIAIVGAEFLDRKYLSTRHSSNTVHPEKQYVTYRSHA